MKGGDIDTGCKSGKEKDTPRVWNDYLSFKTNSRVSAKSFANRRGRRAKEGRKEGVLKGETSDERGEGG